MSTIPRTTQYEVLKQFNFFILDATKVCREHSDVDAWRNVDQVCKLFKFTQEHINRVIEILRDPDSFQASVASGNCFDKTI